MGLHSTISARTLVFFYHANQRNVLISLKLSFKVRFIVTIAKSEFSPLEKFIKSYILLRREFWHMNLFISRISETTLTILMKFR